MPGRSRGDRRSGAGAARRAGAATAALLLGLGAGAAEIRAHPPASGGDSARARLLMGTRLTITVEGAVPDGAFEAAFDEVARLEGIFSNWIPTSEVSRLNARASEAEVQCSPDLFAAIRAALDWAAATGGAFDPTVEPLVAAFGLRADDGRWPGRDAPAGENRRQAEAMARGGAEAAEDAHGLDGLPVGWRHVHLERRSRNVRFDRPGVGVDLGGIGKGIALDAAARVLASRGVRRALLDFGGQLLAVGRPAGAPGWTVGIADPADRDRAVAVLTIADLSIATSGNGERAVRGPDGPVGHILDPGTRRAASFGGSVTVAARDATSTDALSTALFVMGPERGAAWAEHRGIAVLYLWRGPDGAERRRTTRGFEDLLASTAGTSAG